MTTTLTLREANQTFSQCVRAVQAGEEFVITRNGVPVAKLVPVAGAGDFTPVQDAALGRLASAWQQGGWEIGAGRLDRDALHER